MNATAKVVPVDVFGSRKAHTQALRAKDGTVYGPNYTVPKGDFSRFMGYKPPTQEEQQGNVSGERAIEVALQKKMNQLAPRAMENAMAYRNMYISWGRFENEPGRTKDMIKDGMDSIQQSVEVGHAMGIRYLEMQYMFQTMGKNFGVISNLMRVRSEAVKKSISEVR